jgi:hypothetical protein
VEEPAFTAGVMLNSPEPVSGSASSDKHKKSKLETPSVASKEQKLQQAISTIAVMCISWQNISFNFKLGIKKARQATLNPPRADHEHK